MRVKSKGTQRKKARTPSSIIPLGAEKIHYGHTGSNGRTPSAIDACFPSHAFHFMLCCRPTRNSVRPPEGVGDNFFGRLAGS